MNKVILSDVANIISDPINDWQRFDGKTVLITGANGMLPSYMAFVLLELYKTKHINVRVLALVRNIIKAKKIFESYLDCKALTFICQDVSEPISIKDNIDFIIHAASQASPKYYGIDPVGTLNANILGTHYLLQLAIERQIESFLMFSSGGVYGQVDERELPMKEHKTGYIDCLSVRNCYFESKRMAENMCVSYASQYGVNTKIVRVFHTYGPCMDLNDGRAFSDICKNVVEGKNIVLHSDGSAFRTFCYVTDAIVAYFKILLEGEKAEAYNVGNPYAEITIKKLAEGIADIYKDRNIKVEYQINEDNITYGKMKSPVKKTVPDISRIESFGWTPKINVFEGFKRVIDSFIE